MYPPRTMVPPVELMDADPLPERGPITVIRCEETGELMILNLDGQPRSDLSQLDIFTIQRRITEAMTDEPQPH